MLQVLKAVAAVLSLLKQAGVLDTIRAGVIMMMGTDMTQDEKHVAVREMVLRCLVNVSKTYSNTIIDAAIKLVYAVIAKKF